jgi:hypothetical protein
VGVDQLNGRMHTPAPQNKFKNSISEGEFSEYKIHAYRNNLFKFN